MNNDKVAVILTTYNPCEYAIEQIESILNQNSVCLDIHIFDDGSEDGIQSLAKKYESRDNIYFYDEEPSGSAGINFMRAISKVDLGNYEFFCLSDQDDVWLSDKISRAIVSMENNKCGGYSSDLTLFDGVEQYGTLQKHAEPRLFDHNFQGASAGCTYVLSRKLFSICQSVFSECDFLNISKAVSHDWAIYYIARQSSVKWFFDDTSHILYRQHDNNVYGASRSITKSLSMLLGSWMADNVSFMSKLDVPCENKKDQRLFVNSTFFYKLSKIKYALSLRRSNLESVVAYIWWLFIYKGF